MCPAAQVMDHAGGSHRSKTTLSPVAAGFWTTAAIPWLLIFWGRMKNGTWWPILLSKWVITPVIYMG